jgi:hypothetical protein
MTRAFDSFPHEPLPRWQLPRPTGRLYRSGHQRGLWFATRPAANRLAYVTDDRAAHLVPRHRGSMALERALDCMVGDDDPTGRRALRAALVRGEGLASGRGHQDVPAEPAHEVAAVEDLGGFEAELGGATSPLGLRQSS